LPQATIEHYKADNIKKPAARVWVGKGIYMRQVYHSSFRLQRVLARVFMTVLVTGSLGVAAAAAQVNPAKDADPSTKAPAGEHTTASVTHSAAKATTFKLAATATNMVIFSVGTGGLVGGGILTVFNVSKSWGLFAANDYLWDKYFPSNKNHDANQSFDANASFWRTTGKFLTYKPVDTAIKFASIYLYTGSAAAMLVYGTASSVVNTGVFYANDFAWDFYDWSQSSGSADPRPATLASVATAHPAP
jgi:uncharacterized membrane protein